MKQPPEFAVKGKEDWVWKLNKGFYGLKQSGYLWYEKLKGVLELLVSMSVLLIPMCSFTTHLLELSLLLLVTN